MVSLVRFIVRFSVVRIRFMIRVEFVVRARQVVRV